MKLGKFIRFVKMSLLLIIYNNEIDAEELKSYESIYEVTINDDFKRETLGQTYIKKASGELLLDWFNNCKSWVSNQRLYVNFVNSSGVGSVSDIYYSLQEKNDSSEMEFFLQVKENNQIINMVNGKAKKGNEVTVDILNPKKKSLSFPANILFPHEHLKIIVSKINDMNERSILSNKVYEGSLPENYLEITTFIGEKIEKVDQKLIDPKVENSFRNVRMAYFENQSETPALELTANINKQGIVSFFQYDYPTYSLKMNLKKVNLKNIDCR